MKPRILVADIETAPILGYVWGLWDQNVGLNQIKSDWHLLSWSAKWLGEKTVHYMDQRQAKNIEDDKKILQGIWNLLDECDILVTQNGKAFDHKKLNARFILNGMQPPSSYRHIDTLVLAKKHFAFTSNKLEYMSKKLCTKYTKLKTKRFQGFDLWSECLKGNLAAWKEMEKYNKYDVLALEELYGKIIPWDNSINVNTYSEAEGLVCTCGSTDFRANGHTFSNSGKFRRFRCKGCGSEVRSRQNMLNKDKKSSLKTGTQRG